MKQTEIKDCQELIGYTFKDQALLAKALTHSSSAASRHESNERLEFLGDAILGMVVCQELFENYTDLLEGEMTKIKSVVVSRQTCADIVAEIQLDKLLFLGRGMTSVELPTSVMAAVFEAIIGAVYLDGGLEVASKFILEHVRPHIEEALVNAHQKNFKSALQQYCQKKWNITPEYHILDEKGPDHSKAFEVAVSVRGKFYPTAWGKTKKQAEQAAAKKAMQDVGLLGEDE